jgi:alcohol dehydrogenase (cytochrome c)
VSRRRQDRHGPNVRKLSVAWIAHGGDITMGIQETPIVIDGVIYSITSGDRVAALDGKTGQETGATSQGSIR